jgi:hypothetical protein
LEGLLHALGVWCGQFVLLTQGSVRSSRVFYFFPAARLIDAFADYDALEGGPRRRRRCETRGSAAPAAPLIWLRAQQNKFLKISLGGAHVAKSLQ